MKSLFEKSSFAIKMTKSGELKIYRDGKPMDKCSMSMYFPTWSFFAIYWDTTSYYKMACAFINLMCENNVKYTRINY